MESSPIPQFALDRDHRMVFANKAFREAYLAGSPPLDETVVWENLSPGGSEDIKEACLETLETGKDVVAKVGLDANGCHSEFHFRYIDPYLLVTIIDVSSYKKRNDDLLTQMLASQELFERLSSGISMANHSSRTDILTGLNNRRRAEELVKSIFPAMAERGLPFSLITFDIDHFKKFNDTYGHLEGDNVLKLVGTTLQDFVNESETPARIGGEEFLVICPNTEVATAMSRAQELLEGIRAITGAATTVTASIGVACARPNDATWLEVMERADQAMYVAKAAGRNQVVEWTVERCGKDLNERAA